MGEYAKHATCYDGEDKENLKELGSINGMPVIVNREAAEGDVLIYVNVTFPQ